MSTPLIEQIDNDLKQAMRDRDDVRKLTLRSAKTALTETAKASENHNLSEEEVIAVLQKEAKRRRDAATEYQKAGETARADAELAELAVLQGYLPKALSEADVEAMAVAVITEVGATSQKDLGKVMGPLISRIAGRADGKMASAAVRKLLPPA